MLSFVQMVPLVVLIPAIGSFINLFWGKKLGVKGAGYIASGAAILTFIISVLLYNYLSANHGIAQVVEPFAIFDGWIRIDALNMDVNIPWQFRVDTLTSVMLLVVSGVGSLIHIYSIGYISHDPGYGRFFAYLNMFLGFMLLLVTANNFLMMFVGWEGVGVMSFLLIGFWWDKKGEKGWQNSNAARKAMILNRIGDFGILMAIFLMFWTFGTVNYYNAGEIANTCYQLKSAHYHVPEECGEHGVPVEDAEAVTVEEVGTEATTTDEHGAVATDDHSETGAVDDGHGLVLTEEQLNNSLFLPSQLGVFNQANLLLHLDEGEEVVWDAEGNIRGREVQIGTWTLDIKTVVTLIVLFLLLGAAGKSAQFPLLVWLPDAMAGPTPVSALMHAATMVTAGVYLLVRSNVLIDNAPEAQFVIAMIGAITALFGGIAAVGQWDIKRVLAYSTISQLGFMVAAVGIGAYVAAIFHLTTHAIFKALLFLGSGSVIHGVEHGHHHVHEHHGHGHDDHHEEHHETEFDAQDMRNMGGLARRMPVTYITYLVGMLALSGIPIFAGFWSKDEILAHAAINMGSTNSLTSLGGILVLGTLLVAAGFTAFYMWRQMELVFFGEPRSEAAAHAPESVGWMTIPLLILAVGSIFAGFINVPSGLGLGWLFETHAFGHFLESSIPSVTLHPPGDFNWWLAGLAIAVAAISAFVIGRGLYGHSKTIVQHESDPLGVDPLWSKGGLQRMLFNAAYHRLYLDDLYHNVFLYPYERIGRFLAHVLDWRFFHDYFHNNVVQRGFNAVGDVLRNPVDIGIIDGIVNGVGKVINLFSGRTRRIQTGYVRTYAIALLFGVVVVIILMIAPLFMNGS